MDSVENGSAKNPVSAGTGEYGGDSNRGYGVRKGWRHSNSGGHAA